MQFSIITPSFRNSEWLKLCIASVADQGVEHEHIVQDSCSDDDTRNWLPHDQRVRAHIEKDRGMYDAVNRGLARAGGDILAYINCDEQYLSGALKSVWDFFSKHPAVEVAFAHAIVIDTAGNYICDRRASVPRKYHSWVSGNLSILTAATFFRRSLIDQRRILFDDTKRDVSDALWVLRLIRENVRMAVLPGMTSAFTETGENMNLKPNAQREKAEVLAAAPAWARGLRPLIVTQYRLRRLLAGHYRAQPPYEYSIYTRQSPDQRKTMRVEKPAFQFRRSVVPA
ncbi:MAG TPA: glycosyltransferase [Verrucomicrobiae bacterium]|nr:glycosyltransferase [Verrucomicrobiae bacterium]